MKNFRLFATSLIASAVVIVASAQSGEDIASLRAKAEKGNTIAQYNLGLAYAGGHGVPADRVEAYVWLSLARENGTRSRTLDSLIASLDPATLQKAKQRLADQKELLGDKIPVVTTAHSEPDIVATVKTTGANDAQVAPSETRPGTPEQQIAALTIDKKNLSDEVAKAWKEIDALNGALAKAEKEVRNANSSSVSATELAGATKFSRELEASLNRTNDEKLALEKTLASVREELNRTKTSLADQSRLAEKLAVAQAVRPAPSAETVALRDQLKAAQTQVASLTENIAAVRAAETKLHDQVADLEQEKARLAAAPAYPDLSGRVGELQAKLASANTNLEASTAAATVAGKQNSADLSAAAAQILRLQTALNAKSPAPAYPDLSTKVAALEATLAKSTQKLATADQTRAEMKQQLAATTAAGSGRIHELETETERLKNALAAAESSAPSYPDLSGKVRTLEAAAADSNQKLAAAERSQTELKQRLGEAAADLQAASAKSTALTRENETLRGSSDRSQKLLAEANDKLKAASMETDKVRELEAEAKRLKNALVENTTAAQSASAKESETQKLLADAKGKLKTAAKDADRVRELEEETERLKNALAAAKSSAPAYPDLRDKVRALEASAAGSNQKLAAADQAQSALKQQLTVETARLTKAVETAKNRVPAYPDLSDKVRELETRLAAANRQADSAVQTAVTASQQSAADLTAASAQIDRLRAELAARNSVAATPDLSGRVRELESQLADASAETNRAKQEVVAVNKAKDEALRNRGPVYPNLAGRVVELQTALADTKRDLTDAQAALRKAEEARATEPAAAAAIVAAAAESPTANDSGDLQKQLAETEDKLTTALRGYAVLQRDQDAKLDAAAKITDAANSERDTLAEKVASLTATVDELQSAASGRTSTAQDETTRANESLAALQRSTSHNASELAATRALLKQVQGAYTVLANENYQLKARLAPASQTEAPAPGVLSAPTAPASVPAPVAAAVAAAVPAARTHTIVSGDTLFRISQRYYGTPTRWQEIAKANAARIGANGILRLGTELVIP